MAALTENVAIAKGLFSKCMPDHHWSMGQNSEAQGRALSPAHPTVPYSDPKLLFPASRRPPPFGAAKSLLSDPTPVVNQ